MIFLNPHMEWIEKDHLPVFELEQKENDTDQEQVLTFRILKAKSCLSQ